MDNSASQTLDPDATARRRSGRVVRAPSKFTPESNSQTLAAKRKRGDNEEEDVENEEPESDEEMSDDSEDRDSDEDHPAPRSQKKSSQTSRARKPSSKKPKINGTQPGTSAHAASLPTRTKKSVRIDAGNKGTGLFGTTSLDIW